MGRRKTSTEVLTKRGSWRAKARKKAAAAAKRPRMVRKKVKAPIITKQQILTGIPNYDPTVGADDYKFVWQKAHKAIRFFHNELCHVKGELAGQPFILEPWEQAIVGNLFGWVHKKIGLRRYKEAFIEIGRKNGKTPLAAGIILYMLFEDGEPGAEIYGAASEYKQASLVFTHAWGMVNRNPKLREASQIFKGQSKAIEIGAPGAKNYGIYRVISSDSLSAQGFNTHGAVVDELHTLPNAELIDALLTSTGARRQPLIVYITTSDYERPGSICNIKEDYALRVIKRPANDISFLPVIYKADVTDDWTKVKTWRKANPNLEVSLSMAYLKRECQRAKDTPTYENTFKRLHLNIRTQQDVRWIPMADWNTCAGIVVPEALVGCRCFGGLDLSAVRDITGYVLWFPEEKKVLPYFWMPKENAHKREHEDGVPFITWAEQGYIKLTPGNVIDYNIVMSDILASSSIYDVEQIGFDRWGFEAIRQRLVAEGVPEDKLIGFGQGFASMSAPSKEFEKLIVGRELIHGANPVMDWMAGNVSVEMDAAGNVKPSKKKSADRIDGIVSLIIALGLATTQPAKQESVYETRGVIEV